MAQITNIITIHEYNKMTDEQKAALSENNMLAVVQHDWQQVRIKAAIAAMQIVADKNRSVRDQHEQHLIAIYSVELADTLIAELQKKQD